MRKLRGAVAALALIVPLLGACGSDDDPSIEGADDATTVPADEGPTLTAKDYSFEVPAELEGGTATYSFTNAGTESHVFDFVRLDAGKTISDVLTALNAEEGTPPPAWMHATGGTALAPGASREYTGTYEAGTYAIYCPVPAGGPNTKPEDAGKPHFALGMIAQVTIAGDAGDSAPAEDITVTGSEFKFAGLEGIKAGKQTIKFMNEGKENHEMALAELMPGKTSKDLLAFFNSEGPPPGPPPFVSFPGLVLELPAGQQGVAEMDWKAGTPYAVLCFIANAKGPHFGQGMIADVTPA